MKKLLFIGTLMLLAIAPSGWAQVTGVLSGRVVDATDAGASPLVDDSKPSQAKRRSFLGWLFGRD